LNKALLFNITFEGFVTAALLKEGQAHCPNLSASYTANSEELYYDYDN